MTRHIHVQRWLLDFSSRSNLILNQFSQCWDRYSKAYSGALAYAPWGSNPGSSSARVQYQRPLPSFRSPRTGHSHSRSQPSMSNNSSQSGSPAMPGAFSSSQRNSSFGGPTRTPPSMGIVRGAPPPGAQIVMPGDERIGGRRCWRCGGDGTVSFLIFDIDTCPVCNGIGRVFQ